MRRPVFPALVAAAAFLCTGIAFGWPHVSTTGAAVRPAGPEAAPLPGQPALLGAATVAPHPTDLCPSLPGGLRCNAMVMAGVHDVVISSPVPVGYAPADLQSAYGIAAEAAAKGAGQTVGIVAAFDNPKLEADLAQYRSTFHLPPCTTAGGCFRKVDENGIPETTLPAQGAQAGLGQSVYDVGGETSLDVDMVSATCPLCHILVVETVAEGGPTADLARAANTAARMGAQVVSTSYGGLEGGNASEQTATDQLYSTPGTVQLASSGDAGYGVEYPAASPNVIAVGGTSLTRAGGGWKETAWDLAGGACSTTESKPSWQTDPLCPMRSVADVSADADPYNGVAVYDTFEPQGQQGWIQVGGTSASSPMVAGMIALAGNASTMGVGAGYLYAHRGGFNDIVGGATKKGCGDYLCRGDIGYDAPTGLGSPKGLAGL